MAKKNIKCYNSGKIGGLSYLQAYKNFENADQEISAMGFTPVNPIILGLKPSRPYWMHMVWDILLLSRCGHIYLQQNWKSSRGARIEFRVAKSWVFRYGFREIMGKTICTAKISVI
ncbi:DUF4406 domain-containing protein [Phocaeicola plebeius]|nr:DUF4406 domain-containing protein [Phocaeicola plebeius]